jgi:hypothetical protein
MSNTVKKVTIAKLSVLACLFLVGLAVITLGIPKYREYQMQRETQAFFN